MLPLFKPKFFLSLPQEGREYEKKSMQSYIEHIKTIFFAALAYFPHSPG